MAQSDEMMENAREATAFLKAIANEHRLMILCLLAEFLLHWVVLCRKIQIHFLSLLIAFDTFTEMS